MSLPRQRPVLDAMRMIGFVAQPLVPLDFVHLIVALEPDDAAVPLEGQDVRGVRSRNQRSWLETITQPAEILNRLFQRPQRIDVEVVGRLVQQHHVAARPQQFRQVDAVAFAARQLADELLLVLPFEVEPADIRPRVEPRIADLDEIASAGDLFVDGLVGIEGVATLIDVGERDRVADRAASPLVGFSSPMIILNSVVLPAPLGPITPTIPPRGRSKLRSSNSSLSPKAFETFSARIDQFAQRRARSDLNVGRVFAGVVFL